MKRTVLICSQSPEKKGRYREVKDNFEVSHQGHEQHGDCEDSTESLTRDKACLGETENRTFNFELEQGNISAK